MKSWFKRVGPQVPKLNYGPPRGKWTIQDTYS